jgi:hypothetical protein
VVDTLIFLGPWITIFSAAGVVGGLLLLARGMRDYRSALLVGGTSTSTISSAAAGEVRIIGVIEPAELLLVSLLQSVACVYYKASVGDAGHVLSPVNAYIEERSVGFRVRDSTGSLRVFPRGARIEAAVRFEDATGMAGDEPLGLDVRTGDTTRAAEIDRATAIANLLTVHIPGPSTDLPRHGGRFLSISDRRRYREARLEPGDQVTIVGLALPYRDLQDPEGANLGAAGSALESDPEVAQDVAEALATGTMATDAKSAWGNAAIPGFGVGRPVRTPDLESSANVNTPGTAEAATSAERRFDIAPESLVLAASEAVPLLIAHGTPTAVVGRDQASFAVGLLGAVLAVASAVLLALSLGEAFAP